MADTERELLRHLIATIVMRGRVAITDAAEDFDGFRVNNDARSPGEILAHIGDLLEGSFYLMKGEMRYLTSSPLEWKEEVARFLASAKRLDDLIASDVEFHQPIKKLIQGPIADALTHVGQIILLRRIAGNGTVAKDYFGTELTLGEFY